MFSNTKLKAFNAGTMNVSKPLSKKEEEDLKRQKQKEEENHALKEFVETFEKGEKLKTWVKGETVNVGSSETTSHGSGSIYRPTSRFEGKQSSGDSKSSKQEDSYRPKPSKPGKKDIKKPTNLEIFKEELKAMQEQREARQAMRKRMRGERSPDPPPSSNSRKSRFDPGSTAPSTTTSSRSADTFAPPSELDYPYDIDTDKTTTNLFLGNINPEVTEQQLCQFFGRYGPLASVKIMWPRSEEEKARGRNCGFVAFMSRKDGERALERCRGRDVYNYEMKLGWGKQVPIPPQPIYIPPTLMELIKPPPASGLPFNAQPREWLKTVRERLRDQHQQAGSGLMSKEEKNIRRPFDVKKMTKQELEETLKDAVVKVVIPTERALLQLINRMVEFVVKEGPDFEAAIMGKETMNPQFRFLFDFSSPEHTYYRWKIYSLLHGDSTGSWKNEEFRMYEDGPWWRPPPLNVFTSGMSEDLVVDDDMPLHPGGSASDMKQEDDNSKSKHSLTNDVRRPGEENLSDSQRERLDCQIRELEPQRTSIGQSMMWCLEHADAAQDIVECLADSLSMLQTPLTKKLARIYLVSDMLRNCHARVTNASLFRGYFEKRLPEIFKDMHEYYLNLESRIKAEYFKQKVILCFQAWEEANIYTNDFLIFLQNIFLGLIPVKKELPDALHDASQMSQDDDDNSVDGKPLVDYDNDVDGVPLDEMLPSSGPLLKGLVPDSDSDLDGEPIQLSPLTHLEKDTSLFTDKLSASSSSLFIPSKWESVDPETVEAEAVTTSKWELFDVGQSSPTSSSAAPGEKTRLSHAPFSAIQRGKKVTAYGFGKDAEDGEIDEEDDIDGLPFHSKQHSRHKKDHAGAKISPSKGSSDYRRRSRSPVSTTSHSTATSSTNKDERRRAKLREIEVKVMKYQDELESAMRPKKARQGPSGHKEDSIGKEVAKYRHKLMDRLKAEEESSSHVEKDKAHSESKNSHSTSNSKTRHRRTSSSQLSQSSYEDRGTRSRSSSPMVSNKPPRGDKGEHRKHSNQGGMSRKRSGSPSTSYSIESNADSAEEEHSTVIRSVVRSSVLQGQSSTTSSKYRDSPSHENYKKKFKADSDCAKQRSSRSNSPSSITKSSKRSRPDERHSSSSYKAEKRRK